MLQLRYPRYAPALLFVISLLFFLVLFQMLVDTKTTYLVLQHIYQDYISYT